MALEETWSPEKIEAWRVITMKQADDDIGSVPIKHPEGVEMHASCSGRGGSPCEETPGENCTSGYGNGCGYYAYKTREQAISYLNTVLFYSQVRSTTHAIARVLLSGKVIEHEKGYRAEILEVVSFEAPPEKKPTPTPPSTIPRWMGQSDALMAHWFATGSRTINQDNPYKNIAGGGV